MVPHFFFQNILFAGHQLRADTKTTVPRMRVTCSIKVMNTCYAMKGPSKASMISSIKHSMNLLLG